ncbi:hypothetical protein SAMCFNEI73_pC0093 (plasmid) [Sinorhizobium americanum]|uniref:Uncharacterized protein n=1 Tax=Sinorhizobium americanum TaxID=194963 RepID=A0A1L3LUP1_9HYPH|nr:hypothetical protein SAMCFNEI73_pC0093 [Sinorhizobium americanum]
MTNVFQLQSASGGARASRYSLGSPSGLKCFFGAAMRKMALAAP